MAENSAIVLAIDLNEPNQNMTIFWNWLSKLEDLMVRALPSTPAHDTRLMNVVKEAARKQSSRGLHRSIQRPFTVDVISTDDEELSRLRACQRDLDYVFRDIRLLKSALNLHNKEEQLVLAQIGDLVQKLLLCEHGWRLELANGDLEHNVKSIVGNNVYQGVMLAEKGLDRHVYSRQPPGFNVPRRRRRRRGYKPSKLPSQISVQPKCRADTCEALLGAIYLDAGCRWHHACSAFMWRLDLDLHSLPAACNYKQNQTNKDKQSLAEFIIKLSDRLSGLPEEMEHGQTRNGHTCRVAGRH